MISRSTAQTPYHYKLQLLLIVLLLSNTILMGWMYHSFRISFPGTAARLGYKQEVARDLADYNYRLASEMGVLERSSVKEALAGFNYEVEVASSSDELTQIILTQGRRVQEIILREADAKLLDYVLATINQDNNVRLVDEQTHLTVRISEKETTTVPSGFLQSSTVYRIRQLIPQGRLTSDLVLEIDIVNGVGRLSVPYNPAEQLQAISEELDSIRLRMHELRVAAGLAEMTGPGITINLYDEIGGTATSSIIHDADIRDVVNELFGSGAQGISVGSQRLTVTSHIRCSGSLIKVNDKLITVNPVVIQAVGNPELLRSGLDIIKTSMELKRGIRFEIVPSDSIKLPAFTRATQ